MSTLSADFRLSPTSVARDIACAHCTLPVPSGLIEHGAANQFCCEGCRAVYATITGCGLADYYRLRDAAASAPAPASARRSKFDSFDTDAFASLYVTAVGECRQVDLVLEGLTCGACVWLIEKLPDVIPDVIEARLNLREGRVRITWEPGRARLSQIAGMLDRFGYTPHAARGTTKRMLLRQRERTMLIDIAVAFALMGNLMLIAAALYAGWAGTMDATMVRFLRSLGMLLGVASLAGPGRCFFINGWRAIRNRVANLDLPIALALATGGVAGVVNVALNRADTYFDSLSMLVFLLLVGRYLQHRQQRSADASVELLFNLMPSTAHVWRDGSFIDLPSEALGVGDLIEVRPGELVAGDGAVEAGSTLLDQALLTGESKPISVGIGQEIFGGAMNRASSIQVRLTKVGRDTRVGRLMDLVEEGIAQRPTAMCFADRVGRWFVPVVCLAAAATFAFWVRVSLSAAVDHSIAMLIVTCPCILGLATPLTMAVSIGQLARRGILVKSAAALERLADVKTVVFDKTGTLTRGEMRVLRYEGDPRHKPILAAIERGTEHPVARAIVDAFESVGRIEVSDLAACGNRGVQATVGGCRYLIGSRELMKLNDIELSPAKRETDGSTVYAAADGQLVATITLGDELRPDAKATIAALKRSGIDAVMLSGDTVLIARTVAAAVGLPAAAAIAGVGPEEKVKVIRAMGKSRAVAMVGDGVNDAAALASADVGIAVHGGAEASLSAADIYLASPGIAAVADVCLTARHTMRVVRRNFAITLLYNLVAATLAITGFMNPLVAAILMPLSSATTLGFAVAAVRSHKGPQR